jgi:chloramphenicol 3-O phosphotransferase
MAAPESTPRDEAMAASPPGTVAILVNGPSSSGKSTLCRALQDHLAGLAGGQDAQAYARVAFDDLVPLMSERLFPHSLVRQQGGDPARLVSRQPHDGLAGWEYVADHPTGAPADGAPRLRLVLGPHARRLLAGLHRGWGVHLELGTNLIIDHFLQEPEWHDEILAILRRSGARLLRVGVFCAVAELERREAFRGDGAVEERPLGLARRSSELCHAHPLVYDVVVHTERQSTAASVEAILAALQAPAL